MRTGKSNGRDVQKDSIAQEVQNTDKKEDRPQAQAAQGKHQDMTAFLKENVEAVTESKRQAEAAEKAAMDVEPHDPLEKIVTDEQEQQAALDKLMGITNPVAKMVARQQGILDEITGVTSPIAKAAAQQKAIMDKITGASSPIIRATAQNINPIFPAIQANQLERTIPSLKEQYARLESSPITKAMQDAMVQLEKLAQSPMLLEAMKWANQANNMMNIMGAAMTEMYSSVADVVDFFSKTPDLVKFIEKISAIRPFLEAELEAKRQENPDAYKGVSIDEVITHKTPELKKIWEEIFPGAMKRKREAEAKEKAAANLPSTNGTPPEKLPWPVDKVYGTIWQELSDDKKADNGFFPIFTNTDKEKPAAVLYKMDWEEIEQSGEITIPKTLTAFDKRVHTAVMGLFEANGEIMSLSQIYATMGMGKNKKPNAADKKKIQDSLTKMNAAQITISNRQEVQVNKSYPVFEYKGSLLPSIQLTAKVHGAITESAIKILATPPLLRFAQGRKQLTIIPRQLLESPISKTNDNITLEDYLTTRSCRMRANPNMKRKMLYTTIFSNCGIETGSQRSRAKRKIKIILDHWKEIQWINGYTTSAEGITIRLPDKEKPKKQ